ncbi:MAG: hypothetical protein PHU43_06545 [Candidatus Bipolaricaulis sp.]|nr:hypothetical protein [Candidatus Bipolaricaulis sp.]
MAFSGTKRMSDFLWAPMWIPFAGCWGAVYAVRGSWADLLLLCLALPQAALGAWMLGLRVWVYVRIERPMIKAQRERVCNPTPRNGGFPGAGRVV